MILRKRDAESICSVNGGTASPDQRRYCNQNNAVNDNAVEEAQQLAALGFLSAEDKILRESLPTSLKHQ
jgi:hypothetical protein